MDWHKYTKEDANLDYAEAILGSLIALGEKDKEMLENAEYMFNHASTKCENPDLTDWYKRLSLDD